MPKSEEHIGFLGGGNIAFAIGSRLIASGVVKPSQVHVSCSSLSSKSLERWRQLGAHATDKNGLVVTKSDIIFICIKPHLMYQCAQQVEGNIEPAVCDSDKLFISVMTGATLDQIELAFSFMKTLKLIRIMPNTSVQVGAGCTAYTPGRYITAQNLDKLGLILKTLGIYQQVPENMMNAITALTAGGSAYVYTIIKAMADGLIALGVSCPNANKLTAQTVIGAAKMVLDTGKHPAVLRDELCSPGGSTIFGIHELEKFGIRNGFINAIEIATIKNEELGKLRASTMN